ncbi:hypothetical protein GCM10020366_07690 [Saccharopolyspora gregorii]|uniref:Uncharacterized protein n=1 Tax=Saccharopolyspora gregorii TaxID=33914 RepID=A0ABP6RHR5_9PSEU
MLHQRRLVAQARLGGLLVGDVAQDDLQRGTAFPGGEHRDDLDGGAAAVESVQRGLGRFGPRAGNVRVRSRARIIGTESASTKSVMARPTTRSVLSVPRMPSVAEFA